MNVLVTGASKGIGKAISERFTSAVELKYSVFTPTRDELDLADSSSIDNFLNRCDVEFDVIINNAGINEINLLENITDIEIQKMIDINLVAPIKLLRGLIRPMQKKNSGRIVNIGSIWGVVSKEGRLLYSATKHSIHGLTSVLAVELAKYNILVNTVCPGYTLTELTHKNNAQAEIDKIAENIPLKRMAQPSEIAELVYFLASTRNTYITGQQIVVDGGFSAI